VEGFIIVPLLERLRDMCITCDYLCANAFEDIGDFSSVLCAMSSIKQIGCSVPTLCRKMTISHLPTRISLLRREALII